MATEEMINEIHALVAAAVKGENERIIELLEDYIPRYYKLSPNSDEVKYPIEAVIELIRLKGK
jgi:hypothetical protein